MLCKLCKENLFRIFSHPSLFLMDSLKRFEVSVAWRAQAEGSGVLTRSFESKIAFFFFYFLSFARSSHLDPERTWGTYCSSQRFTFFLQMRTLQLTIGCSFGLPSTNFVRQNMYLRTMWVPDPTFLAVGLCFWMVRKENCAPKGIQAMAVAAHAD